MKKLMNCRIIDYELAGYLLIVFVTYFLMGIIYKYLSKPLFCKGVLFFWRMDKHNFNLI